MALSRARHAALLGIVLGAASVLGAAEGRDAYRNGIDAVEQQDWQAAAQWMEQAVRERPEETTGMFRRYLPHYYLGLAHYQLGDCTAALAAWDESMRQGVISKNREIQYVLERRSECTQRLANAALARARGDLEEVLQRATVLATALDEVAGEPELSQFWNEGVPTFAARRDEALRLLDSARRVLSASSTARDLAELGRGRRLALQAEQRLAELRLEAGSRLDEVRALLDQGQQAIGELLIEADRLVRSLRYLQPFPPGVRALKTRVDELMAAAGASGATARPGELDSLRAELSDAVQQLQSATTPPPSALTSAVQDFLDGRYDEALVALDSIRTRSRRVRSHVALVSAASRHALYLLGGETDPELLAAAREDVDNCHRLASSLRPPERAFSPRFIDFFRQQIEQPESPAADP